MYFSHVTSHITIRSRVDKHYCDREQTSGNGMAPQVARYLITQRVEAYQALSMFNLQRDLVENLSWQMSSDSACDAVSKRPLTARGVMKPPKGVFTYPKDKSPSSLLIWNINSARVARTLSPQRRSLHISFNHLVRTSIEAPHISPQVLCSSNLPASCLHRQSRHCSSLVRMDSWPATSSK